MGKEQKYEIIDAVNGNLTKIGKGAKAFMDNVIDSVTRLPDFANDILKSFNTNDDNYHKSIEKDKSIIEEIVKKKIESGNYTDEELRQFLKESRELTKEQGKYNKGSDGRKAELFAMVAGAVIMALAVMSENKNKEV